MSERQLVEISVSGNKKANTERLAQALEGAIAKEQILGFGVAWDENKMPTMVKVELAEGVDIKTVQRIVDDHLKAEQKTDFEDMPEPLTLESLDARLKALEERIA